MMRALREQSIEEILAVLDGMNERMNHVVKVGGLVHTREALHYVGSSYDFFLAELRERGEGAVADRYEERAATWKQ